MSNYNSIIEQNNLDLTSILSTINELPDANEGGVDINGTIRNYTVAANETINAGDFVSIIPEPEVGTDTRVITSAQTGHFVAAAALDANRVFVAYSYGTSYLLYGRVYTVENGVATGGTAVKLSSTTNLANQQIGCVALDSSRVFISYASSAGIAYGMVCTINNTTITAGTGTALNVDSDDVVDGGCKVVKVAEDVVLMYWCEQMVNIWGCVCSIDGNAITAGSVSSILSTDGTPCARQVAVKDLIVYIPGEAVSDLDVPVSCVTINPEGLSFSKSDATYAYDTDVEDTAYHYIDTAATTLLPSGQILLTARTWSGPRMAYWCGASSNYGYGGNSPRSGCLVLGQTHLFFTDSLTTLSATFFEIANAGLTNAEHKSLSTGSNTGAYADYVIMGEDENDIFIIHSYGSSYTQSAIVLSNVLKAATTKNGSTPHGIAKTSGVAGETIEVYFPSLGA